MQLMHDAIPLISNENMTVCSERLQSVHVWSASGQSIPPQDDQLEMLPTRA